MTEQERLERIAELEQEIKDIVDEMSAEKSFSVDGKITISRRSMKELSAVLSYKKAELNELNGTVGSYGVGNSVMSRRGGFE